ncbi:MAG: hypothetical protein GY789_03770 [Hyphomicrobiales bacterium]|nr:hypothetical protein [Hyphomicrobiales bacterium]MCP4997263.1 hypothetical protein [Hyphomicrobiales bacterium]
MDATGIALEGQIVSDVGGLLAQTNWKPGKHQSGQAIAAGKLPPVDNLATHLRILRMAPTAIRQEARWTKGVLSSWPQAGKYLETHTGYAFPVLSKLTHKRAIRATTTILRDNLDAASSACGLAVKPLVAFLYAAIVEDEELERAARALAKRHCGEIEDFEALAEFATQSGTAQSRLEFLQGRMSLSPAQACCLLLAQAAAPSPATPEPDVVRLVRESLEPAQTVEIMTWISVLQLLHRLDVYFGVLGEEED